MAKVLKKPYMGWKKPTGKYNSTAKAFYVLAFEDVPFKDLRKGDGIDSWTLNARLFTGAQRPIIKKLLDYALDNNMNIVIKRREQDGPNHWFGEINRPIYGVYKYWKNDLIQEPEYIEKLFPFPMTYGIINSSIMDDSRSVSYD